VNFSLPPFETAPTLRTWLRDESGVERCGGVYTFEHGIRTVNAGRKLENRTIRDIQFRKRLP
jgi:hypothetical protein